MPDKTVVHNQRPIYAIKRKSGGTFLEGSYRMAPAELNCDDTVFYSPYEVKSYRDLIRDKQLATTDLTVTGRKTSSTDFEAVYRLVDSNNPYIGYYENTGYLKGQLNRLYPGSGSGLISISAVADRAWVDFVKKAKNAQRSFQGGVFLGELREAIQLVRKPAMAIRRGLDEYVSVVRRRTKGITSDQVRYKFEKRKRKFAIYRGSEYVWPSDHVITRVPLTSNYGVSRRRAIARVVHDTWLEYSFGVKPLLNDAHNAAAALGKLAYKPDTKRVTGKASATVRSSPQDAVLGMTDANEPFVISVNYRSWREETLEVKFHGGVSCDTEPGEFITNKAQHLGVSWSDLAPTIWELIPYSFVVDYFTNIGDLIEVASFQESSIMWKYRSSKRSRQWTVMATKCNMHETDPGYEIKTSSLTSPGRSVVEDFEIKREAALYSQPPSLRFKVPGVGSTKWINMAALVASRDSLRRELRI